MYHGTVLRHTDDLYFQLQTLISMETQAMYCFSDFFSHDAD